MSHIARIINAGEFNGLGVSVIEEGISKISGKLIKTGGVVAHAYEFDDKKFTPISAKAWLESKKISFVEFSEAMAESEMKSGARHSKSDHELITRLHGMTREMQGHLESLGAKSNYPQYRPMKAEDEPSEEMKSWIETEFPKGKENGND